MAQKMLSSLRPGGSSRASGGGCGTCVGFSVGPQGAGVTASGGGTASTGIENTSTTLGYTYDANETLTGTVTSRYTVGEDGTGGSNVVEWWQTGASAPVPYAQAVHGDWSAPAGGASAPAIQTVCKCDDVAGDGSNIVKYVEAYQRAVSPTGVLTSTLLGTFTDATLTVAYAPVTPSECEDLGVAAVVKQGRLEITGGNWSPGALVQSYTIRVATIGDPLNPPTFTDGFGNVTAFELGEVISYGLEDGLIDTTAVVGTSAGDRLVITYTELGS